MRYSVKVLMPVVLIAILTLSGCAAGPAAPTAATQLTKAGIQLGWTYDFTTAQFYAAQKNGRYTAQNLDVTLEEGGFVNGQYADPIGDVLSGKADFGLSSDLALMQARAKGQPVVAVAAMTQRSPEAILSLAKSNIRKPQDLIGHKVAVAEGGASMLFNALLRAENIDPAKITVVPRTDFGLAPLLKGDVDALLGWTINEGVQLKQSGQDINIILLSDYGVESYNTLLFTTEQMLKDKPEVVQKFLIATLQGISDVAANPDQAVDYVMAYGKNLDRKSQAASLQTLLPLINPSGSKPGMMDDATWKASYQMGIDQQLVDKSLDIASVYTLNFLKKIYQ